jgi:hypothetical protein
MARNREEEVKEYTNLVLDRLGDATHKFADETRFIARVVIATLLEVLEDEICCLPSEPAWPSSHNYVGTSDTTGPKKNH